MAFLRDIDNIIPIMSANNVPSGYVASSSSAEVAGYEAWKAFNGQQSSSGNWWDGTPNCWLRIDLPTATIVNKYNISSYSGGIVCNPKDWIFQGSNDGTNWTNLDIQANITSWGNNVVVLKTFIFPNTTAYSKYRINISANNGSTATAIGELELCSTGQYASLIPAMNSNITSSGIASASSYYGAGYEAYKAFTGTIMVGGNDYWVPPALTLTGWIAYEFAIKKIVKQYSICPQEMGSYTDRCPKTWTFEGWNGSSYITLDTQTNITDWQPGTCKTFFISNTTEYIKYRLNVSANNGSTQYLVIGELRMFGTGEPINRWKLISDANDLQKNTLTTLSSTDKGTGITLSNGDLTYVSTHYNYGVRSTTSKTSGKWYVEFTALDNIQRVVFGVCNALHDLNNTHSGTNFRAYGNAGWKYPESTSWGSAVNQNDIIGMCVDIDAGTLTWYKNNILVGTSHTTLPSGPLYVLCGNSSSIMSTTGSVKFSGMTYSAPSGYAIWGSYDSLNLTNNGGVTFSENNGASFNGSSQWLNGNRVCPPIGTTMVWFKPNAYTNCGIIGASNPATTSQWGLILGVSNIRSFHPAGSDLIAGAFNTTNMPTSQHKLLVCTWDGTTHCLYDGVTRYTEALGAGSTATTDFSIGRDGAYPTGYVANGYALDARIYDYPLTPTEVNSLYAAGPNGILPSGVDDNFTKSLLHFDGNLTDQSGKTWTANGGASTSTTQSKFGGNSLNLVGASSQYLSTSINEDLNFNTGDFTIDFWVYGKDGNQGAYATFGATSSDGNCTGGFWLEIGSARAPNFTFNTNTSVSFGSSVIIMPSSWEHWALVRYGTSMMLFRQGTQVGTTQINSSNITSLNTYKIGFYGNPSYTANVYIDEYRVSKVARWTSNFTPPTQSYGSSVQQTFSATGGTVTNVNGKTIHTFTSSGTFTVNGTGTIDALVVAGGGGGGQPSSVAGGGGGAGGLIYATGTSITTNTYQVVVGLGGLAGNNGNNSSFNSLIAIGGGCGGQLGVNPGNGGSGGGGRQPSVNGGLGTAGQGNNGGAGGPQLYADAGAGGGGKGSVGGFGNSSSSPSSATGGNGGQGEQNSISGTSLWYAAGGGGGVERSGSTYGIGGNGIGGNGGNYTDGLLPTNGVTNTGSGGGGGHAGGSGSGGSGIVIISYTANQTPTVTYLPQPIVFF